MNRPTTQHRAGGEEERPCGMVAAGPSMTFWLRSKTASDRVVARQTAVNGSLFGESRERSLVVAVPGWEGLAR